MVLEIIVKDNRRERFQSEFESTFDEVYLFSTQYGFRVDVETIKEHREVTNFVTKFNEDERN